MEAVSPAPEPQRSPLATKEEAVAPQLLVDDAALKDSTDAEITKIRLMRAFVETRDPSAKEVDDLMIRRFLRARDLDVEKASAMFLKYLKWKRSFVPNGYISPSEIPDDIAHEKMYVQGVDKKGRPITVAFAAKHYQNKHGVDVFKHIKGWGYANSDLRGYLGALSILQDYYPERLGKLLIVHAPYMFMKVWKMIYPFIDDNTKKKIVFVDNKKLKSTLLEDIDESQLPDIYGGQMPLVPIQDS
ncbi:CRAL/TRIO, N-terminal domain [Sesbania bispinosa]|nr:CRAL/TRIO, N-terminal domain [Sesbania bispinosa]